MRLKPITSEQYTALAEAEMMLRRARAIYKEAGATRTYKRVCLALTSAQGALRHAHHRARVYGARLIVRLP